MNSDIERLTEDVAAARRERDEMREERDQAELELAYLANEMVYNGNSIGWIASKADNYKAALGHAWDAFTETGGRCDGKTSIADAIRQRNAFMAELMAAVDEVFDNWDCPGPSMNRLRAVRNNCEKISCPPKSTATRARA